MSEPAEIPVAVLLGGGIESTALVQRFLAAGQQVIPIHVSCGLIWDAVELEYARRFCAAFAHPLLEPLIEITVPLSDYMAGHWAITGKDIPQAGDPASRLELPIRNLLLLALVTQRLKPVGRFSLALGTTADNSYRDGSRAYFDQCEQVLSLEVGSPLRILTPWITAHKTQVIQEADPRALALSFSCVNPQGHRHCGGCIKCGRRHAAFAAAEVRDPTDYVFSPIDERPSDV